MKDYMIMRNKCEMFFFFFTDVTKTVGIIFNPQMLFTTNCKKVDEHLKRTHTEHLSHAC